jgi:hypothetical protein
MFPSPGDVTRSVYALLDDVAILPRLKSGDVSCEVLMMRRLLELRFRHFLSAKNGHRDVSSGHALINRFDDSGPQPLGSATG